MMYRLQGGGYRAYMVGGSVRDLMLGRPPKDFDIATDARPQEIRRLFRNARIIGRRFRLVHILFGAVIVEVSTFRREPGSSEANGAAEGVEGNGADGTDSAEANLLITSDNIFGSPAEDAFRRDFTVNALFYDISDFSILDYVGGIDDLHCRVLRTIGDPMVRFREDPVRMLRACELAGRLGFTLDPATQGAIHALARELEKASMARVTEEIVALLRCGSAGAAMQWMLELGVLEVLLPEAYAMISAGERGLGDFGRLLPTLDRKVLAGKAPAEPSDGALIGALLLPGLLLRRFDIEAVSRKALRRAELVTLVEEVAQPLLRRFSLSKARSQQTLDALNGFLRLCEPHKNASERQHAAARPWFRDALWLFDLLVEATGEGFEELAQWQAAARRRPVLASGDGSDGSDALAQAERSPAPTARRRSRRRKRR